MNIPGNPAAVGISVVIPTYNYAAVLPRAIASVIPQLERVGAELIVIDDGSTDGTPQVIERLLAEYNGYFRAITQANGGPASVRNRGIEAAAGQFLVFLDADDELAPGALLALTAHIAQHPESRLVIGEHWSVFASGKRSLHRVGPLPASARLRLQGYLLDKTFAISNGACALHREVFATAAYPERFRSAEDIPVFAQALAGFPCSVLDQPLALIHKHADSLRHNLRHAQAVGLALVDEVFSPERMPASLQDLRKPYLAQRCLSLFRTFYSAGEFATALSFYRQALAADARVIFRWSYTRKALRLWLRK